MCILGILLSGRTSSTRYNSRIQGKHELPESAKNMVKRWWLRRANPASLGAAVRRGSFWLNIVGETRSSQWLIRRSGDGRSSLTLGGP